VQDWIADTFIKPFTGLAVKAIGSAGDGVAGAFDLLAEPQKGMEKGLHGGAEVARMAYQLMRDASALALMPDDSPTRLKGTPGTHKRVAWCEPIPLDEVRAVGKALNCSINDVLLSSVAGAIGAYLRAHGDAVQGKEIRAMVPVNLRPLDEAYKLGNRFGLAPVVLPIGLENPIERVYEVRRRMGELKDSLQPLLAFGLLAVAGLLIKPAQDAMLGLFSRKTTAVMTNVPGPREKLKFLGATLEQSLFWVPQSGSVGLGVSILSYGGGVQFGVITDSQLCPDPQNIINRFEPEFAKLSLLTLMLPWGE
jgi:diacylglycerol O-acyltransferase / wax synthase